MDSMQRSFSGMCRAVMGWWQRRSTVKAGCYQVAEIEKA